MTVFEIIAFGNAEILEQVLNGLAMMTSDTGTHNIGPLVKMGLLLAVILIGISSILSQKIEPQRLLIGLLFFYLMFVPKVTVSIYNPYNGDSKAVANVPVGVAAPLYVATQMGQWWIEAFEFQMSDPEFNGDYIRPMQLVVETLNIASSPQINSVLQTNLTRYIEGCVVFAANDEFLPPEERIDLEEIMASRDAWGQMETKYVNKDIIITEVNAAGAKTDTQTPCAAAYAYLTSKLTDPVGEFVQGVNTFITSRMHGFDDQTLTGIDYLEVALNSLTEAGGKAQEIVLNQYVATLSKDVMYSVSDRYLSASSVASVNEAIKQASAVDNYSAMSRIFASFVEALIVMVAPLVAVLAAAFPQMISAVSNYFILIVWVSLWQPLNSLLGLIFNKLASCADNTTLLGFSPDYDCTHFSSNQLEFIGTNIFQYIQVYSNLWIGVPAIAAALVFGTAKMLTGNIDKGTAITARSGGDLTADVQKTDAVASLGSQLAVGSALTRSAQGGTLAGGADVNGAGTLGAMVDNSVGEVSSRGAAVTRATTATDTARESFINTASNTAAQEIGQMVNRTNGAQWSSTTSTSKDVTERIGSQYGWDAKQKMAFDSAVQLAAGMVNSGTLDRRGAGQFLDQTLDGLGLKPKVQGTGRVSGSAGAEGSHGRNVTDALDHALTKRNSTDVSRSGGTNITDTSGFRNVSAKVTQSQQAREYALARQNQETAQEDYKRAAQFSSGVKVGNNLNFDQLSGVLQNNPALAQGLGQLASMYTTGSQRALAARGLSAHGVYGKGGSASNVDRNIVNAKALADNGRASEVLDLLAQHGVVTPTQVGAPGSMTPGSNRGLEARTADAGLTPERQGAIEARAGEAGNRAEAANMPPAGGAAGSGGGAPSGDSGSGGGVPGSAGRTPDLDAVMAQYESAHLQPAQEQQRVDQETAAADLAAHQPNSGVAGLGQQVYESTGPAAAAEAAGTAARVTGRDVQQALSQITGEQAAIMAASAVGGSVAANQIARQGERKLAQMAGTASGRQQIATAISAIIARRGAQAAAGGAIAATGVGAPLGAAIAIGSAIMTAADMYSLYKQFSGGGSGSQGPDQDNGGGGGRRRP